MKFQTKVHSKLTMLFLALSMLISTQIYAADAEKTKSIHKTFKVTAKHVLEIENQFGKVDIKSWDKNEIKVDIEIIVDVNSDKKAQQKLDEIQIDFKESSDRLSIKTNLGSEDKDVNITGKQKIEINYTIMMPITNELDLENKFGAITLDQLKGRAEIEVQFGSAKIGKLFSNTNDLVFKFSDPIIIDEIGGGEIDLKFSKLELGKSGELELSSQMSDSKIGDVQNSQMKVNYGSIELKSVPELKLNSSMSTIRIAELKNGGDIDVQYGKLIIGKLSKDFKGLTINSKFTPVEISVEQGSAFNLDADTKMSEIKLPSGYKAKEASEFLNDEYFKGIIGEKGGELPTLKITNSFGNIEIN